MSALRPRTARISGLLATAALLSAALMSTTPAVAVSGPETAAGAHPYVVRLNLGDEADSRACTGTLVDRYWVLTAASCFAATPGSTVAAGKPALRTTAKLSDGSAVEVTEVAPRADRDAALVRLATPATGIAPAPLATEAPATGAELTAAGFGRTKTEWVPDKLHTGTFTLDSATSTTLAVTGKGGSAICKGDTGSPLLNASGRIIAVNSRSWQGGCLGAPATETRTGAISTRTDDLADWLRGVRFTTASIRNALSNRCAYVDWRTPENGAPAQQVDCDPQYVDQLWKLEPVPGGGYQIRNHLNNRCLVVPWATPQDGAPVTQYDCNPAYGDQVWKLEPVPGGGYSVRNSVTDKCMYVPWSTPEWGAPLLQVGCDSQYADQVWKI
ncbi:RICIN domain-containing protein [Streptomyces bambusae]|uniref:RICIN domain-containing protein n=1 Tax=Streptomyces bambusae TaxID=1550616 RepID=UPI001CA4F7FE|nr:RICIN domain-containing protein [Streptomyces bambusae]